jgi:hypothetical protein
MMVCGDVWVPMEYGTYTHYIYFGPNIVVWVTGLWHIMKP